LDGPSDYPGAGILGYENIIVERDENVAIVILDRPQVLNALSSALMAELDAAVGKLEEDAEVSVIVLTGTGNRAFSSGGDIHEMARLAELDEPPPADPRRAEYGWHMASCKKPTIGAINGLAYGGAALMASSLDIRIGCENTSFRFLAATYGRVNATWSLPMQIGWPAAKELLFTGRVVEASEAYRIGLLNHLVAADQLMLKAMEIAKLIAANDGRMVQGIKELMIEDVGATWRRMYDNELGAQSGKLRGTPVKEGFKDFLQRKGVKRSS
jgi:enoyl-CoA hydratase